MEDHTRGGAVKPPKPAPVKHTLVATLASGEEVELGSGLATRDAATKVSETFRNGVTVNEDDGSTRYVAASQVVEILRTTDEPPAPPTP